MISPEENFIKFILLTLHLDRRVYVKLLNPGAGSDLLRSYQGVDQPRKATNLIYDFTNELLIAGNDVPIMMTMKLSTPLQST